MSDFAGRVVLITGAAGGIGQAMARLFGERGATIAALDKSETVADFAETLNAEDMKSAAAIADIGAAEEVAAAIAKLREALGPISVLINNAGMSTRATLEMSTPSTWGDDVNVNLNGAFNCTHAVLDDL